jgi:hypothetical protein
MKPARGSARPTTLALIVFGLTCACCCAQTDAPLPSTHPGHLPPIPTAAPSQSNSGVYSLPQLIDMGERNNPQTRVAWEQAKQAAEGVGIAPADLFSTLAFDTLALKGDLLFYHGQSERGTAMSSAHDRPAAHTPAEISPRGYAFVLADLRITVNDLLGRARVLL